MNLMVLFRKEWLEAMRNYKVLTAPLVFLFLSMLNILLYKKLPDLLSSSISNMPKGTVIHVPPITGVDAITKIISQYDSMGALIIILLFMGTIAGERASGVMTTILIKPVTRYAYVGSKYLVSMLIVSISFLLSMIISYFYIQQFFTHTPTISQFLFGSLAYLPKLLLLCGFVILFSSISKSSVLAGGLSFVLWLSMDITTVNPWLKEHAPNALSSIAIDFFTGHQPAVGIPITLSLVFICICFFGASLIVSRREL